MLLHKNITDRFSLIHLNARSLNKNLDHLIVYLDTLKYSFDIITVTETWANSNNMTFFCVFQDITLYLKAGRKDEVVVLQSCA